MSPSHMLEVIFQFFPVLFAVRQWYTTQPVAKSDSKRPATLGKEWAELSPEEFDQGWINYFSEESLDDWELRRGINVLYGQDAIPDPKIVVAVLRAARRQNDVATAIRFLEAVKEKTAGNSNIYSYILKVSRKMWI